MRSALQLRGGVPSTHSIWLALLFVFAGAAGGAAEQSYTDPAGLISFDVPDGWVIQSDTRGMRFRRATEKERSMLSVTPSEGADATDIDTLRATRQSQVRSQSRHVIVDTVRSENGVTIWEFAAEPGSGGRGPISHSVHLLRNDLRVEVMLIAMPDRYPAYVEDLRSVVASVSADI